MHPTILRVGSLIIALSVIEVSELFSRNAADLLRSKIPKSGMLSCDIPSTPRRETDTIVKQILAHPLFAGSRLPEAAAQAHAADVGGAVPRLSGIIVSTGRRRAIFETVGGKPIIKGEGDYLRNYKIITISQDGVMLGDRHGRVPAMLSPMFIDAGPTTSTNGLGPNIRQPTPRSVGSDQLFDDIVAGNRTTSGNTGDSGRQQPLQ